MSSRSKIFNNCLFLGRKLEVQKQLLYIVSNIRNRGNYTLYNSVLANEKKLENIERHQFRKNTRDAEEDPSEDSLPITLKYLGNSKLPHLSTNDSKTKEESNITKEVQPVQFPFQTNVTLEKEITEFTSEFTEIPKDKFTVIRYKNELFKEKKNWMLNYDNFDDTLLKEEGEDDGKINYGTPDPKSNISKIPCGGCGAHLHCKDPSLPGYIPSEIFKNSPKKGGADLTALICQRCYFLKHHNIALEVQVSTDDYPKVLQTISKKEAVVVLMVDLTDFPCSIWPGIADIFHKKPIIVVGNKVDLLPKDSTKYLDYIKNKLTESVKAFGFGSTKLIDVLLISATTGYGVENLITVLHNSWKYKGNVYLVGCTNVGKSSLFNALISSDYCKSQAEDLIQRATTSVWPGTTLSLLKFPIARPSGFKLELRKKRLRELRKLEGHENSLKEELLRKTNNWNYAVLMGRIDRSTTPLPDNKEQLDSFSVSPSNQASGRVKLGIDAKDPLYALGRWCYDTPGVVQPDQIIHLLTSDELYLTLPKTLIAPQSFCVKPGESLFIAGLARLDLTEGEDSIRLTVFCSKELPLSLCKTEEADQFYNEYLGTEYMKVPSGSAERLQKWPGLTEAKSFTVRGIDFEFSAKDVVLSNAGWISITGRKNRTYRFKAWTPEKRGVYLRDSMLPQAVALRGPRIRSSPAYQLHRYFDVGEQKAEMNEIEQEEERIFTH